MPAATAMTSPRTAAPTPPPPRRPAPAARVKAEKGWIESGLYVMTLPIAITAGMMYAPVAWFLKGRSRG
jgi:hypothetical protein